MTVKDRTLEFHAAVDSLNSRNLSHQPDSARLLAAHVSTIHTKSDFARHASAIGKDINTTVAKLHKLTQLAKRKSLFDDRPVEINELVYIIKQDLVKINQRILQLQAFLQQSAHTPGHANNKQTEEHSNRVITSLQSKLVSTSNTFKEVLEIRTQNMKDQKSRREQFTFGPASNPTMAATPPPSDSPLYFPERRSTPMTDVSAGSASGEHIVDFGSSFGETQQLVQRSTGANMEILESRAQAIESIESTIAELGQVFQHFARVLAEQREMVQRIDDNVVDTERYVEGAHTELLKYWQDLSRNRWLMLKVFAVVLFFFVLFVVFL
ncbi:t-SNARE [Polychytrium aggregatum]|uniref:t-SNARE n=1 Tax=Polychytrium aggregatum TaxID=110093 RepID=UPI0022FEBDF0|nr:t-SNARE [Polychytrium aggregatum]KAI9201859.1 t-SNARE [Polychytrium aggregatum]